MSYFDWFGGSYRMIAQLLLANADTIEPREFDVGYLYFLGYLVMGIPVVWYFIRQQKLGRAARDIPLSNFQMIFYYKLVFVWPILVFAIVCIKLMELAEGPPRTTGTESKTDSPLPTEDAP